MYRWLLRLYPASFRAQYASEMEEVFSSAIRDQAGWKGILTIAAAELAALPRSLLVQHMRSKKGYAMPDNPSIEWPAPRWWEILMSAGLLLIPAFMLLGGLVSADLAGIIGLLVLAIMLAGGIWSRLARWSLPGFGFLFSFAAIMIAAQWMMLTNQPLFPLPQVWTNWTRLLYQFLGAALSAVFFLGVNLAGLGLLMLIPPFRPFIRRAWKDWTLLSFVLYGATPLFLIFGFDEYHFVEPLIFACSVCLALGAWGFLRSASQNRRWLWLAGGIAASGLVSALGTWLVVPLQLWPGTPDDSVRISETVGKLFGLISQLIYISLPALIPLWKTLSGGFLEAPKVKPG
jgi:hypothetical protein